jgi:hypothetical protein
MNSPLTSTLPEARHPGTSAFRFDESLCTEILTRLQTHLKPGAKQARFGCINGSRAAVYMPDAGYTARALWLHEDDVRDWFVARYSHDMQQMQEIEQEILAEFSAQLMEQRLHNSQKHHAAVMQGA